MAKIGFYDYDSAVVGEDGVIYKEPLTSLPASGAEIVGVGTGYTFTSAGFTGEATSGIKISGVADQDTLDIEGTIRVMVSADVFSADYQASGNENFIVFKLGATTNFQRSGQAPPVGSVKIVNAGGATLANKINGEVNLMQTTKSGQHLVDGLVELIITWDMTGIQVWIDNFKSAESSWVDSDLLPTFTEIYINSVATSGGVYTWKNLLISNKRMVIKSTSHATRCIHFYGDSYTKQGNYSKVDASGNTSMPYISPSSLAGFLSYTEDGLNGDTFDGQSAALTAANRNAGMLPGTHKELTKRGLFTKKIRFWGEGGTGYETANAAGSNVAMPARVDIALSGNYDLPDAAVIVCGYNDASGTGVTDTAAYKVLVEGVVGAIQIANPDVIIVMTTMPYCTHVDFNASLANTQAVNAVFKEVADAYSAVTLIDIYEEFGGATNDGTTNMSHDFIHPDAAGNAIYGPLIAQAIGAAVRRI